MELYEQIICEAIAKEVIPFLSINNEALLEMKCYQAIKEIHKIISDEKLD